jgi:hypothetical protein
MVQTNNQESAPTAAGGGRATASPQSTTDESAGCHACISDIFSNGNNNDEQMEYIIVSEGVSKIKRDFVIAEDEAILLGGGFVGKGEKGEIVKRGRKGPVVMFSRKSRRNLMIKLAEIKSPFEFWQDFTFADDIMEGLTVKERSIKTSKVLKAFKLWLERKGYKLQGVWKREWRARLTGFLQGQYVPHFHMLYSIKGFSEKDYFVLALLFAKKWVEFTGTKNYEKALQVAQHHKSYRLIKSRKQANLYVSDRKYISKYGEYISEASIGRNWGFLGEPEFAENEIFYLNLSEMVLLRRILRKFIKKDKKTFRRLIAEKYKRFFLFVERSTIHRILLWIAQNQMNRAVEGVPF